MGRSSQTPQFTFFCELASAPLVALFEHQELIEKLQELDATVSLGILDLSEERAEVVRRLDRAGIAVTAWLLLPEEQGYWFNLDNAHAAVERYLQFKRWSEEQALHWGWLGIDIEPDIRELQRIATSKQLLPTVLLRNMMNWRRFEGAREVYGQLVAQMQADGYRVESYQLPLIEDERAVGSTLIQRALGLIDIPVDREILMTYSSFLRPHGAGVLWSYGRDAEHVALGSTGGGVQVAGLGDIAPLTWLELSRDLRLAWRRSEALYIFSLEGCVRHGYLESLQQMDWSKPVVLPAGSALLVDGFRKVLRLLLWTSKYPIRTLLIFLGLRALRRMKRKQRDRG